MKLDNNGLQQEGGSMATRRKFCGIRLSVEEQRKAVLLSVRAGEPGNMSAGLRWALEQIRVSGDVHTEIAAAQQPEQAVIHA